MVTAAATATVNRIPVLFLPGDTYACRQPDPVLQQVEQSYDPTITTNDAFKPVSKFWDRINRPEQIMAAAINAMRVLTDPAETGAVTICLPHDVQAEAYEYPEEFLAKCVWSIERQIMSERDIEKVVDIIRGKKKPVVICGGGVRYSDAGEELKDFCQAIKAPMAETAAGKGVVALILITISVPAAAWVGRRPTLPWARQISFSRSDLASAIWSPLRNTRYRRTHTGH